MSTNASSFDRMTYMILAFSCPLLVQAGDFAGGTDRPEDPYRISTAEHLVSMGSDPNLFDRYFILANDIDLDPNRPGGRAFAHAVIAANKGDGLGFQGVAFGGCFDGGGHKIKRLSIKSSTGNCLGLFGNIGASGFVQNLRIEDLVISGSHYEVGGLAGINRGTIINCHAVGRIDVGPWPFIESLGGLIGHNTGRIFHSQASVDLNGDAKSQGLGGLVGTNVLGRVVACRAAGKVAGADSLGGLVGNNFEGTIMNCYALGSTSSEDFSLHSGGLVGDNQAGTIVNCYGAALLRNGNERWDWGGLVGQNSPRAVGPDAMVKGVVVNCFWDMEVSGVRVSDGAMGLATAHMYRKGSFTGWDFENTWMICEGKGYPRLRWEKIDCDQP